MGAISQHHARSNLIMEMKDSFITFIYETKAGLVQQAIRDIAVKNAIIRGTQTPEFLYEGKWYPQGVEIHAGSIRDLDSVLMNEMHELLHEADYDAFEERHMLSNYLVAILQFAKNSADLKAIFPYPLHNMLFHYQGSAFELESPKPKHEILVFKEAHQESSDCLNAMLVMRMLFKQD